MYEIFYLLIKRDCILGALFLHPQGCRISGKKSKSIIPEKSINLYSTCKNITP